ncbi:MAG: hypothetical protein LBQ62_07515 [Candidatus Accumulibacter sp.]|jgi:hypothetical protein|nr:hypothetical protein [Accumulibacter sp.]
MKKIILLIVLAAAVVLGKEYMEEKKLARLVEKAEIARAQDKPETYRQAADNYAQAAKLVAERDVYLAFDYRFEQAGILSGLGEKTENGQALREAVALYREMHSDIEKLLSGRVPPKEESNEEKSRLFLSGFGNKIQFELAGALFNLGKLENDSESLETAMQVYGSLMIFNYSLSPRQQARIQYDSGRAILLLGKQKNDWSGYSPMRAAAHFRQAAMKMTPEKSPWEWSMIQLHLGDACSLGIQHNYSSFVFRDGKSLFEVGVEAYEDALSEFLHERAPLDWARAQNSLGNLLLRWAWMQRTKKEMSKVEAALVGYQASLREFTPGRMPLAWAVVHHNIGHAFGMRGLFSKDDAYYGTALSTFREAAKIFFDEGLSSHWAETQVDIGRISLLLGFIDDSASSFEFAVDAFKNALNAMDRNQTPVEWARIQGLLGTAWEGWNMLENDAQKLQAAANVYRTALPIMKQHSRAVNEMTVIKRRLQSVEQHLAHSMDKRSSSEQAAELRSIKISAAELLERVDLVLWDANADAN